MTRRHCFMQSDQHIKHADKPDERRHDGHEQHHKSCEGERDDVVEAVATRAPQNRRASHALSRHARCQGGDGLEQPAARALPQLRLGRGRVRRGPLHRPTSIDATPSASWPSAVLIAVTSPWMSAAGGVTTKRKLRSTGPGRPLKLTLAWACRMT